MQWLVLRRIMYLDFESRWDWLKIINNLRVSIFIIKLVTTGNFSIALTKQLSNICVWVKEQSGWWEKCEGKKEAWRQIRKEI